MVTSRRENSPLWQHKLKSVVDFLTFRSLFLTQTEGDELSKKALAAKNKRGTPSRTNHR